MPNIVEFSCVCGASSPSEAKYYEGCLGYECIVCRRCGRIFDHEGEHEADEFSRLYVGLDIGMVGMVKDS